MGLGIAPHSYFDSFAGELGVRLQPRSLFRKGRVDQTQSSGGHRPAIRLSAAERAALYPDLDYDALERLLSALPVNEGPAVLRYFRDWTFVDSEEALAAFPDIHVTGPPGERTFVLPLPEHLRFTNPDHQSL